LFIHAFGAYFGLALSLTMRRQKDIDTKHEKSSYNSDIFAMTGEADSKSIYTSMLPLTL